MNLLFYSDHFPIEKKEIDWRKTIALKEQTFFLTVDDGGRFDESGFGLLKLPSFSVVPIASRLLISA